MEMTTFADQPLVCDLTAIPITARAQHITKAAQLFPAAQAIHALADGYAFRFPNQGDLWLMVAQFIEHERRCCPFFHFTLAIEPNHGPIWLWMTGGEGVKELLGLLLAQQVDPTVLSSRLHTGGDAALDRAVALAIPQLAGLQQTQDKGG